MRRIKKRIRVNLYGQGGEGATKTEAKEQAGRLLTELVKRVQESPVFLHIQDYLCFIVPDFSGYRAITWKMGERIPTGTTYFEPIERVKVYCRDNLAQLTWKPEYGMVHPDLTPEENKRLSCDWEFQLRYISARAAGLNDIDAHDYAGRNPSRPDVWRNANFPDGISHTSPVK